MFILYCASDNSYSCVENENVIFNEENINKGDEVIFTYNNKQYTGKVIDYSDNKCYLEKQFDKLKLMEKAKKSKESNKTEMSLRKRRNIESSPSLCTSSKIANAKSKNNTKNKVLRKIQRTSNSVVFDVLNKCSNSKLPDNNASDSKDHSPTKEELKKMLFETRKELKEKSLLKEIDKDSCQLNPSQNINNLEMEIENNSDTQSEITNSVDNTVDENVDNNIENLEDDSDIEIEEFEDTDTQLYGKNFEPKMIHLKNNVYCRNAIYYAALGNCHRSSHMVRRLLTGVFKKEALINCTLTGQTPRSQGKNRQNVKVSCLHPIAIKAIVDFSLDHGIKHGWATQTKKDLLRTITQRIGEIKREARNE
ncbi:uncharacterized protein [Temnothorax nylanderi]|uniref:uncharacterized protein n=1 Tax=Temnothorax nylanderi TaxID=102681 RepID=UPI003A87583A